MEVAGDMPVQKHVTTNLDLASLTNYSQGNVISEVEYCFESATNLFKEMNELNKPLVLTNEVFEFTSDNRDTENDPFKGTSIEGKD